MTRIRSSVPDGHSRHRQRQSSFPSDRPLHVVGDVIRGLYQVQEIIHSATDGRLLKCTDLKKGFEYEIKCLSLSTTTPPWRLEVYTSEREKLISEYREISDAADWFEIDDGKDKRFYLVQDYTRPEKLEGPKGTRSSVNFKGGRFVEIDIPAPGFGKYVTGAHLWCYSCCFVIMVNLYGLFTALTSEDADTAFGIILFCGFLMLPGVPFVLKWSFTHVHIRITPKEWTALEFFDWTVKSRNLRECFKCLKKCRNSVWPFMARKHGGKISNLIRAETSVKEVEKKKDNIDATHLVLIVSFQSISLGQMDYEEARWIAAAVNQVIANIWHQPCPQSRITC